MIKFFNYKNKRNKIILSKDIDPLIFPCILYGPARLALDKDGNYWGIFSEFEWKPRPFSCKGEFIGHSSIMPGVWLYSRNESELRAICQKLTSGKILHMTDFKKFVNNVPELGTRAYAEI